MNLAAAAGGALARAGVDYLGNRIQQAYRPPPIQQPSPYYFNQMAAALPRARGRGRGRGRRGRGRGRGQARSVGQPNSGIGTTGSGHITIVDTEVLGAPPTTLTAYQFTPSHSSLPRLSAHAKMYERYKINYFNISFRSGSSTNVAGNISIGVSPGPKLAAVVDQATILKLKPSFYVPAWKNESLSIGKSIDTQKFMHVGRDDEDGISFTLYVKASAANLGMLQVSYSVQFAYPVPF